MAAGLRLAGVEIYFEDLERARDFYRDVLGLVVSGESPGHHVQFDTGAAFLCLEKKGVEDYPSADKAVVFFHVRDLRKAIERVGRERVLRAELEPGAGRPPWAVLHDPEGHNVLLLQGR